MEVKIKKPDVPLKCFVCNLENDSIRQVSDRDMFRVGCARVVAQLKCPLLRPIEMSPLDRVGGYPLRLAGR